jgi:hypothetical protein
VLREVCGCQRAHWTSLARLHDALAALESDAAAQ